jgi:hypothetical protein
MCQRFIREFVDSVIEKSKIEDNSTHNRYMFRKFRNMNDSISFADFVCTSPELPVNLYDRLKRDRQFHNDYFLSKIHSHKLFCVVKGPAADKLKKLTYEHALIEQVYNYFHVFGQKLFQEIHQSVDLLTFFDEFNYDGGRLCLFKYDKTAEKLLRNMKTDYSY